MTESTENGGGAIVALVLSVIVTIIGCAWYFHDYLWRV